MSAVLGLDLSTSSTGISRGLALSTVRPRTKADRPVRRLNEILDRMVAEFEHDAGKIKLAVVEGYSLGGLRGYAAFRLGELGGAVRLYLFECRIDILEVPPSTLKKYATGNGGRATGKEQMIEAARAHGAIPANDDEADAYFLWHLGAVMRGEFANNAPTPELTKIRSDIIETLSPKVETS